MVGTSAFVQRRIHRKCDNLRVHVRVHVHSAVAYLSLRVTSVTVAPRLGSSVGFILPQCIRQRVGVRVYRRDGRLPFPILHPAA